MNGIALGMIGVFAAVMTSCGGGNGDDAGQQTVLGAKGRQTALAAQGRHIFRFETSRRSGPTPFACTRSSRPR
jgi:hypothetical protein